MPTLDPDVLHHPAVVEEFNKRAADAQLRVADKITAFAGSMNFVYLHIALFVVWMLVLERSPWPTLTLAVSLEAIFLSTFVMIGQNRQAAFQQAKSDRDYQDVNTLLVENTNLTRAINQRPKSSTNTSSAARRRPPRRSNKPPPPVARRIDRDPPPRERLLRRRRDHGGWSPWSSVSRRSCHGFERSRRAPAK